ncbi:ABC transporter permease [Clostridium sp.]|uniref:ABC transporter permease n=1 Tax=Clostridium sp. TaxID=1506 RepID=UPI002FC84B55
MNKGNLTGWRGVFNFTLIQTLKSKAFIISYVILIVLMLISMPLIRLITTDRSSDISSPSPVKKVYVNNETALPDMNFSEILKDSKLSHITFEPIKEDLNMISDRIQDKEKESIILTITESQDKYSLNFIKASDGPIGENSLQLLASAVTHQFEIFKINVLGIEDEQLTMINAKVSTNVYMADVNGVEIIREDTSISNGEYWFIYGILFIVMMVNIMASTQIATSIVTEKSTRVIEYLLTSVKPLAIMVGKIMAMLTAVLLQVISMIVILFLSNRISSVLSSNNVESVLSQYLSNDIFQNLNIINIVFCLIVIVLGMIFYATLAGVAGASISRLEEMNEGLTLFTLTNIIGAYIGIGAASVLMASGLNSFVFFSLLFPLSSVFILPGALLVGKATLPIVAGAIALQVIFIILLFKFVARVYETLILHNGNKIKIKELLKISKNM